MDEKYHFKADIQRRTNLGYAAFIYYNYVARVSCVLDFFSSFAPSFASSYVRVANVKISKLSNNYELIKFPFIYVYFYTVLL